MFKFIKINPALHKSVGLGQNNLFSWEKISPLLRLEKLGMKSWVVLLFIFLVFYNRRSYQREIFKTGERGVYVIRWNGLRVGTNILELKEKTKIKGQDVYHIITETWTQGIANVFFKVNDKVETFIDVNSFYPLLYRKDINEGRYHKKATFEFNHEEGVAVTPWGQYSIPRGIHDPLSVMSYFRTLNIQVGDVVNLPFFNGERNKFLHVNVLKKETIQTCLGKLETKIVTFAVGKEERDYLKTQVVLWVWFSNDKRMIPVRIRCRTGFGYMIGDMVEYSGGEVR